MIHYVQVTENSNSSLLLQMICGKVYWGEKGKLREINFEKIDILDDVMFYTIMSDPENCKEFLQRILGIQLLELKIVEEQKNIKNRILQKGVRLDIYAKDVDGNAYDIEMQKDNTEELPLRSRYYHSQMDNYQIRKGAVYTSLGRSIVIFICDFDLFIQNRSIYTFQSLCIEQPELCLDDKRSTIFLNIQGDKSGLDQSVQNVLKYFQTGETTDSYTKRLEREVKYTKEDDEWRQGYMEWNVKVQAYGEMRYRQGREEALYSMIQKKLAKGKTVSQIASECEEDESTIRGFIEKMHQQEKAEVVKL